MKRWTKNFACSSVVWTGNVRQKSLKSVKTSISPDDWYMLSCSRPIKSETAEKSGKSSQSILAGAACLTISLSFACTQHGICFRQQQVPRNQYFKYHSQETSKTASKITAEKMVLPTTALQEQARFSIKSCGAVSCKETTWLCLQITLWLLFMLVTLWLLYKLLYTWIQTGLCKQVINGMLSAPNLL